MIAQAIGPQNVERVSGIIARMAASAVSMIGRRRWTAASRTASRMERPWPDSASICAIRITELRSTMPNSASEPSIATKPNGMRNSAMISATPISASGPVASTTSIRLTFWSCSISRTTITIIAAGTAAMVARWLMLLCSCEPPFTSDAPAGRSGAAPRPGVRGAW
jgi:hypothetical protein